jgi:creatinase
MKAEGSYVSLGERARRYNGLRRAMSEAGVPVAIVVGSPQVGGKRYFRYLTDWNIQSIGGYVVVPESGDSHTVFRASSQAFWAEVVGWAPDIIATKDPAAHIIDWLARSGADSPIGIVGKDFFPVADYQAFQAAAATDLVDLTAAADQMLMIKSADEVSLLRETAQVFDRAWEAVLAAAAPGMTEWELTAMAGSELLQGGVSHHVILIGASNEHFAASCPGWPRDRRLEKTDIVQMSLEGPGPAGYSVEVGGTFGFVKPDQKMAEQFDAQVAGILAGVEALRPGSRASEVSAAVDKMFIDRGFSPGYWAGHGIGLGIPEPPILDRDTETVIEEGMAVALHPNAVGEDGRGTLISRTYIVGSDSAEQLSRFPLQWEHL